MKQLTRDHNQSVTKIDWHELPRGSSKGAAVVYMTLTTGDSVHPGQSTMRYLLGDKPARYPVPAIMHHLDLIACEPMLAWEDFKAIGFHGIPRRCCYT